MKKKPNSTLVLKAKAMTGHQPADRTGLRPGAIRWPGRRCQCLCDPGSH